MNSRTDPQARKITDLRLNAPLVPALAAAFGVLYAWTGYRGWLAFAVGFAGAWLLAAWWVYSLSRTLSVRRSVHTAWAGVGQSVPEQLEVRNRGGFPATWLELADESEALAEPLGLVTDVERYGTRRRYPVHLFKRRGLYTLGPTRLRTGDPFGIYTLTIHDPHASTVLVTPPQLALSTLRIGSGGWGGDQARRRGPLVRAVTDAGIRDYLPGDSLKRIHWRASAHQDSLAVRQMEAEAAPDWWIVVDLERAAQWGAGQESTLELSIVLAASLAARGLRERRRVGMTFAGPQLNWLPPRGDPVQRWRILRALARADAGRRPLADLLSMRLPSHSARLIVVTPSTSSAWIAAGGHWLSNASATVLLVDPTDFGSDVDQAEVRAGLARRRIPFTRMPGSLLHEAYASSGVAAEEGRPGAEYSRRYLRSGASGWARVD
ncbi:MAG: DUF58 domain-containing protein [Anaerolineales bacterium]